MDKSDKQVVVVVWQDCLVVPGHWITHFVRPENEELHIMFGSRCGMKMQINILGKTNLSLLLLVPYPPTFGTLPSYFWYLTLLLLVPYPPTFGTLPSYFWYLTLLLLVPYPPTFGTLPSYFWYLTLLLLVPYPPTFGTFFIQVDAPFETIRYCGFEWWNNCVQCWLPKWFWMVPVS